MGLLQAIIDAIGHEVNKAAGCSITHLAAPLPAGEVGAMDVDATARFGPWADTGPAVYRLLIGGEIIHAAAATTGAPYQFTTLTRGAENTIAKEHPAGAMVLDMSGNTSALGHARRGFFVRTAIGEDLDVIARNLGMPKCPGLSDEQWRRIITAVAYLPKQPVSAFEFALEALFGNTSEWEVYERLATDPWSVYVEIITTIATDVHGRFYLTGGYREATGGGGGMTVTLASIARLRQVFGVYPDTQAVRRGKRDGVTNYFAGGSFVPGTNVVTLGSTPGAATPVIVDAAGYTLTGPDPVAQYHYLAPDETMRHDGDRWAYLADPLRTAACVLDHVRPAGVRVSLRAKLP